MKAVIPPAIRRRWDAIALRQLTERAVALETENDQLRAELGRAEDAADHWFQNCQELTADAPGLTVDGRLVRAEAQQS